MTIIPIVNFPGTENSTGGGSGFQINAAADSTIDLMTIEGDYLIAIGMYISTSSTDPTCVGNGITWTLLAKVSLSSNRYIVVFGGFSVKTSVTASLMNITPPATTSLFGMFRVAGMRNVDLTTPMDVAVTTTANTTNTVHSSPAIVPVTDGSYVLAIFGGFDDNGAGGSAWPSAPAGWDLVANAGTATGSDGSIAIYGRMVSPAASTSVTVTASLSLVAGIISIALRPRATPDPVDDIFVGRSIAASHSGSSPLSLTCNDPLASSPPRWTPATGDLAVCYFWANDSGIALLADPGAPWVPALLQDFGNYVIQIYTTPWAALLTWPTFVSANNIDRSMVFGLILRGIDPNNPIDASAFIDNASSATITFPAVTPVTNDVVLLRIASFPDDLISLSANISAGNTVQDPIIQTGYSSSQGLDESSTFGLQKLSGGAGGSTGTATATKSSATVSQAVTIALKKAPAVHSLISSVDVDITVDSTFASLTGAIFLASEVELEAEVQTSLRTYIKPYIPPRTLIWVHNYGFERVNVID